MALQKFKENDVKEGKVRDIALPLLSLLGTDRDAFFEQAYEASPLGQVLYNLKASPLARAISEANFVMAFSAIHKLFTRPGNFEFYLEVFRLIWGEDVDVEFVVPAPGKLIINVEALAISLDFLMARTIVDNAYVYDEFVDENGDNIMAQVTSGIKTQSEADALIYEFYPAGLWVQINLSLV